MEKQNEYARRAARRVERDRKRLEMGSDYETSEDADEFSDSDYGDYGEEEEDIH